MRSTIVTRVATKLGVLLVLATALGGGVLAASAAASTLPRWHNIFAQTYSFHGEGEITFETAKATKIKCTHGINASVAFTSFFEGKELEAEQVGLSPCTTALGGECTSPGAPAKEILLNSMLMRLEYISPTNHEAGLILNYNKAGEVKTFAKFSCTILGISHKYTLRGNVLGKVTPVNVLTPSWTLSLKGSAGKQEFTEYVNEAGKKVVTKLEEEVDGSGSWESADMTGAATIRTFPEAVDLEA